MNALSALALLLLAGYCIRLRRDRNSWKEDFRAVARRADRAERERDEARARKDVEHAGVAKAWFEAAEEQRAARWKKGAN